MDAFFDKINKLFINGIIDALILTAIVGICLLICYFLTNKFIKKRWPKSILSSKRIQRKIFIVILIFVFLFQIHSMTAVLAALLASGGLLAVVIGLASQEAASDLINGMMIIMYHPYNVDDFIFLPTENVRGKVIIITVRHTIIETLEKTQVIIPNTIMNKTMIENISNIATNKANHLFISISYESDINKAITIIQELASTHPLTIDNRSQEDISSGVPEIEVLCVDLQENGISLRATIFTQDNATGFSMMSDLRIQVKQAFDKNNITIPYPQVVVHNQK